MPCVKRVDMTPRPVPCLVLAAIVLTLIAGCSTGNTASALPTTDVQEPVGEPLLIVATSGPFSRPAERTEMVQPDLVIWDDGLVAVNVGERLRPDLRAVQLRPRELADFKRILGEVELRSFSAASTSYGACIDCPVTIIQIDNAGHFVEIAARGAIATSEYRYTTEYPAGLQALRAELDRLREKVRGSVDSVELNRNIPLLSVAPRASG